MPHVPGSGIAVRVIRPDGRAEVRSARFWEDSEPARPMRRLPQAQRGMWSPQTPPCPSRTKRSPEARRGRGESPPAAASPARSAARNPERTSRPFQTASHRNVAFHGAVPGKTRHRRPGLDGQQWQSLAHLTCTPVAPDGGEPREARCLFRKCCLGFVSPFPDVGWLAGGSPLRAHPWCLRVRGVTDRRDARHHGLRQTVLGPFARRARPFRWSGLACNAPESVSGQSGCHVRGNPIAPLTDRYSADWRDKNLATASAASTPLARAPFTEGVPM